MEALIPNLSELFISIEECKAQQRILSTLVLIYSGIDVLASLERQPSEGTKASFVRWCEDYLLKAKPLHCTGLELYGARCGVLHTFAAESDLSRSGQVREVIYAWGNANKEDLQAASMRLNRGDVAIHLDDLVEAFRLGTAAYFEEVEQDSQRTTTIRTQAGVWLTNLSEGTLIRFLDQEN